MPAAPKTPKGQPDLTAKLMPYLDRPDCPTNYALDFYKRLEFVYTEKWGTSGGYRLLGGDPDVPALIELVYCVERTEVGPYGTQHHATVITKSVAKDTKFKIWGSDGFGKPSVPSAVQKTAGLQTPNLLNVELHKTGQALLTPEGIAGTVPPSADATPTYEIHGLFKRDRLSKAIPAPVLIQIVTPKVFKEHRSEQNNQPVTAAHLTQIYAAPQPGGSVTMSDAANGTDNSDDSERPIPFSQWPDPSGRYTVPSVDEGLQNELESLVVNPDFLSCKLYDFDCKQPTPHAEWEKVLLPGTWICVEAKMKVWDMTAPRKGGAREPKAPSMTFQLEAERIVVIERSPLWGQQPQTVASPPTSPKPTSPTTPRVTLSSPTKRRSLFLPPSTSSSSNPAGSSRAR